MEKLEFTVDVNTTAEKLWNTMLAPDTYREWVNAVWPGSYFEGRWAKGETLRFLSPGMGGTKVVLDEHTPYEYVSARHIAVINPDGQEDTTSEAAKGWIGSSESYTFSENNGVTHLKVTIETYPAWKDMFLKDWPKALNSLKEVAEKN